MRRLIAFATLAAALAPEATRAADTSTDVGLFAAVLAGTHTSSGITPEHGVIPGAALEVTQHLDRLRIHLEGIPTVSASVAGSGSRTSASLAVLNATALVDIDPQRRFRAGAGFQVVDLTNQSGDGVHNAVRVTSPIFTFGTTLPVAATRFVEANLLVDPNVRGILKFTDAAGAYTGADDEIGAEVDYSFAYGIRRGRSSYLIGARGLSYHTRDATTGALVDRNVAGGLTFEARFALGR